MSFEHRLHQLEEKMERLEKSYRRLLHGILKVLGEDIEKNAED